MSNLVDQLNQAVMKKPDVAIVDDPLLVLFWQALRLANWAAGEGLCPIESESVRAPDEFLMDYSNATGEEDWETLPDRLPLLLADRQAREEARDGGGWRTIDSAPTGAKGVAFMMLAFGPQGDQTVSEGMHFKGRFYAASIFHKHGPSGGRQYGFKEHEVHPTHWRPTLPAPTAIEPSPLEGDRR